MESWDLNFLSIFLFCFEKTPATSSKTLPTALQAAALKLRVTTNATRIARIQEPAAGSKIQLKKKKKKKGERKTYKLKKKKKVNRVSAVQMRF